MFKGIVNRCHIYNMAGARPILFSKSKFQSEKIVSIKTSCFLKKKKE